MKKGRGISPASLAFDIDGVVADTMSLFLDIAREKHGVRDVTKQDMTCYMLEECLPIGRHLVEDIVGDMLSGNYGFPLKPLPGARKGLEKVWKAAGSLLFVTARPEGDLIREWLHEILDVPEEDMAVIATGDFEAKARALLESGKTWFVEDRLETCFLLDREGIRPVVFEQPWNRKPHPFAEVGTWEQLQGLIRMD